MVSGLPNSPLPESTVTDLGEGDAFEDTIILAGLGLGKDEPFVIQFLGQTDSATYVLCFAAPNDDLHDGWFKLADFDHPDDDVDAPVNASKAAEAYIEEYGQRGYLEKYYDGPLGGRQVYETSASL